MKFSTGVIVGLAAGYYLGTKAGRERYEEIERWLDRVRATDGFQDARARLAHLVGDGHGPDGNGTGAPFDAEASWAAPPWGDEPTA